MDTTMKTILLALLVLSSATFADVSVYRGLATTHLFMDNSYFNNNNGVTIVKVNDVMGGYMTNSYGEEGYFLGWQPKVYSHGDWEGYAGIVGVAGYRRWQLPYMARGKTYAENQEKVITALPVISISYSLTDNVAFQINNMAGVVVNAGVRIDF